MATTMPHNLHDGFFQRWMAFKELAQDLLQGTVPEGMKSLIDFASATPVKGKFLDEKWQQLFADVSYSFKTTEGITADVVVIYEHKSYLPKAGAGGTDKPVVLQLLEYIKGVWEADYQQKEGYHILLPVVFYHGTKPWPYGTTDLYLELFPQGIPQVFRRFQPTFDFILIDTSDYSDERLKSEFENSMLRAAIAIMRDFKRPELLVKLYRYLTEAHQWRKSGIGREFFRTFIMYWRSLLKKEEIDMETVVKELEAVAPQAAEEFVNFHEATLLEGEERGRHKGRVEGRVEDAQRMLEDKVPLEKVLQYTQLTRDDIAHLL